MSAQIRKNYVAEGVFTWWSLCNVCQYVLVSTSDLRKHDCHKHNKCIYIRRWRRQWHPTPVLLPGKSHGRRSLVGCSPWGHEESDTAEWLHFHFPLSCIGEGNGNPLQCSCLENPRDGGAWSAAVYGVAQSRTRLKRLSSSSSTLSSTVLFQMSVSPCRSYSLIWLENSHE